MLAYFNKFNRTIRGQVDQSMPPTHPGTLWGLATVRPITLHDVGYLVSGMSVIDPQSRVFHAANLRLTSVVWKQR